MKQFLEGFAPPSSYSFAPPPIDNASQTEQPNRADTEDDEDPYARRLRLTQMQFAPPTSYSTADSPSSRPPPIIDSHLAPHSSAPSPPLPLPSIPPPLITSATQTPASVISRAPVRYTLPAAPSDLPTEADIENANDDDSPYDDQEGDDQEDQPRSNRPGQQGFAERLMSKYGWKKGTGLGADSSGIVQPLHVKVSKGKEKKGTGQIIDRNKKRQEEQEGKFGKMSQVVVLKRMVDGMEDEDVGVLMQEIGDECAEKVCFEYPSTRGSFVPLNAIG